MPTIDRRDIYLIIIYFISILSAIFLICNAYLMIAEHDMKVSWFSPAENIMFLFNFFLGIVAIIIVAFLILEHHTLYNAESK